MAVVAEETFAAPEVREDGSRLGRNIAAMAGGQIVTWTMSLVWTLIVPRALGPAGMGLIVTAWSVTGVLGLLLGLGTRNYLVREMVVREEDAPRLLGTAMVLRLALSPLFVGAALIYARVTDMGTEASVVLYLAVAATIFVQIAEPLQAGFQAIERMEYLAYSEVISKSAQGLVGVVIALVGFGAIGITGVWAAMTGLVVVLDLVWLGRRVKIQIRTTLARLADMIRQSLAYWAFGVFFTIYLWIDALMLSLLTDPEVVGWYGVPMKLFQTFMFLPVVLSTAWLPRLVRTFEEDGQDALRRASRRPVELVLMLGLPVCAAIVVGARPFVDVIYGSQYAESVPVLTILALCIPPMYLNIILSQILVAAKRQIAWTWVMGGATLLNPALNAILIPLTDQHYGNGAIGSAISLLLTEAVIVTVGFRLVGRGVFDASVVRRVGLTGLVSLAAWAASELALSLGEAEAMAAAAVVFVVLARAARIVTAEEIALARSGAARVLARRRR
jgi:O-antigen/teichoic acid export membrane protein